MNRIVIADTSCLIALDKITHLHILQHLFTTINITSQVYEEYGQVLPNWFVIHEVVSLDFLDQMLDPGEASAITLALSFDDPLVIIDEKRGRKVAQTLHLSIAGTLKVLLLAKQKGIVTAIKPLIQLLESNSFRFNKAIIAELLVLAGE